MHSPCDCNSPTWFELLYKRDWRHSTGKRSNRAAVHLHVPVGDAQSVAVVHRDHELLEQRLRHVLGHAAPADLRLTVHQLAEIACGQPRASASASGMT